MTVQIQRRTRTLFIWVALIPVFLAILAYATRVKFKDTVDQVRHTQDVLISIDDVVEGTTSAETAQRGYLLTGKNTYLQPLQNGMTRARGKLENLRGLLADHPQQRRNLDSLSSLVQAKLGELLKTVELRQAGQGRAALDLVNTDQGLQLMEQIQQLSRSMIEQERTVLAQRLQASQVSDRAVDLSFVSFITATLLLLLWATRLIRDYANERERAEAAVLQLNNSLETRLHEIDELNRSLEHRVAQRTRDLEESNQNLSRSNADLERFAYVASHDLQEPLRMIASYVGLIRRQYEGSLDARADEYITYAVDGAKRMQNLIDDLLAYSRASTQALNLQKTNLEEVLEEAILNLKPSIEESNADIRHDPLPTLPADPVKLMQVFQNLLGNALKFRDPLRPLSIYIAASRSDSSWEISIRDNGIGFEAQFADRIFVIFQRLHGVQQYAGTGIGLAICKRIIEAHGGRIWVESKPGEGSVFRFDLPASNSVPKSIPAP